MPDPVLATLSADLPLVSPDQDRLGYTAFAGLVANAIAAAPADGVSIGVHGGAGTGRTSVVNFVRGRLSAAPDTLVVDFNPWLLGAELDVCERFFAHVEPLIRQPAHQPEQGGDAAQARDRLAAALRARGGHVVVVMDDLDRLSAAGMREVGRLVRSVGGLPNLVYLLVFDRARRDAEEVSRVVQLPLDLPLPESGALPQLFLDHLRDLLERHPPPAVVTQHHFDQAFSPGIETLLRTPRDVVRLVNALSVSYPPLSEEVNTADFIAVEALRVFVPGLHDVIRRNPSRFAGTSRPRSAAAVDADTKAFHEAWREALEPAVQLGVTTLVLRLFPSVPDFEGLIIQRDSPSDTARRELRVASGELFPAYFRLAVPATTISNAEMDSLLAQATSAETFAALLVRLAREQGDGGRRAEGFLDRLIDLVPALTGEQVAPAVGGLLEAGDQVGTDLDDRLVALMKAVLARIEPGPRLVLLRAEMGRRAGVGLIVSEVARLGREHGRHGGAPEAREGGPTVDLEGLGALEQVALTRIREAAAAERLVNVPRLSVVLDRWRVWDRNECQRWVAQAVARDDALGKLLAGFVEPVRGPMGGDWGAHGPRRLDLDALGALIPPEQIADRVRRLAGERTATGSAQTALELFVVEYGQRQEDGDAGGSGREGVSQAEE
ncbi:MAG: P-loop NTPase fold protein [Gaiellales bacterium]